MRKRQKAIFWGILLAAVAIRLAGFGAIPAGINQDEAMAAVNGGFLPLEWLIDFLREKPAHLEVVLTGRNPPPEIAALCDYHSEMIAKAHPYKKGIPAREGIEF